MGRAGITLDQVIAAANALEAERPGSATLKAVRDYLGTGSQTTIHQHLKTWREPRLKAVLPAVEIPDDVRRTLTTWLMHASTLARAEAEDRVANAEVTADELARAGELVERERDELLAEVADLTTQRDQAEATAAARAEDIERLKAEVNRERDLAGKAQIAAAAAEFKLEGHVARAADLKAENSKLDAMVKTEHAARTDAERLAAVTATELAGSRTDCEAARAQVTALQQELTSARERAEQARSAADARAQQDQARIDQVRQNYETRLDEQRRALEEARAHLAAAAVEKVQLQERLSALTGSDKK